MWSCVGFLVFFFGLFLFYLISSQKALWKRAFAFIQDKRKENVAACMLRGKVEGTSEERMWETGLVLQQVWTGTNVVQCDPGKLVKWAGEEPLTCRKCTGAQSLSGAMQCSHSADRGTPARCKDWREIWALQNASHPYSAASQDPPRPMLSFLLCLVHSGDWLQTVNFAFPKQVAFFPKLKICEKQKDPLY